MVRAPVYTFETFRQATAMPIAELFPAFVQIPIESALVFVIPMRSAIQDPGRF